MSIKTYSNIGNKFQWLELDPKQMSSEQVDPEQIDPKIYEKACEQAKEKFSKFLNQILDAENLIVLTGSGTSLTFNTQCQKFAPSMWDLWNYCKEIDNKQFYDIRCFIDYDTAGAYIDENGNKQINENIELFLSRCDTFLQLKNVSNRRMKQLETFLPNAKQKIVEVTDFCDKITDKNSWKYHEKFIQTLGRRNFKQKRLKLFTTNYDLAFETAASNTGMIVIDGFEFSRPYRFNPTWFNYDIVHRSNSNDKSTSYLPNIFHLYKIHGSVDWIKTAGGIQKKTQQDQSGEPVIIYPSSTKYQTSYEPPYLDMMSAFLNAVQKPKTAILCLGFGFNDNHINNAILMALRTNPEIIMMVGTLHLSDPNSSFNKNVRNLLTQSIENDDSRISLVDCTFQEFVERLPNRNQATPEEEVFKLFQQVIAQGGKNE